VHARHAAKNLRLDELPLLITPHPINDLTPDQVLDMAKIAYPTIVKQLTSSELEANTKIDYVLPAERAKRAAKTQSEAQ
jgi:hypothetical protein